MSEKVIVSLFPWEYDRAFEVGVRRFIANWGRPDAKHYDRSKMEEDRQAQAAAAICECAVARYLNQFWHGHVWHWSEKDAYRHLADIGTNVEVRRVRTQPGPTVRPGDAGRIVWGARTADPEWRTVEILGWVNADIALAKSSGKDIVVPASDLNSPQAWQATEAA